jgi:hypothetical protein
MTGPRDWDKELAEIDKLMGAPAPKAQLPPGDPGRVTREAERGGSAPPARGGETRVTGHASRVPRSATVWLVALLGPVGAVGLAVWPYPKTCGLSLGVYLVGVLAVWGASIWAMRTAWAAQRGLAMVIGVITLLASLTLSALEVLPRVGYARHSLTWTCST